MTGADRIRVVCADDNPDLCELLSRIVSIQSDMVCVASLQAADDLVAVVQDKQAGVVIIDRTMDGKDPLEAVTELKAAVPDCRVVVFTGWNDPEVVRAGMAAGATEVIVKHGEIGPLIDAVRRVARA